MTFSALNVDFDGPSLDFLGSRKSAYEGIKEQYPCKSRYFTTVASLSQNRLQIGMGMLSSQQALVTSFSVVSTSMTLKDPELPK